MTQCPVCKNPTSDNQRFCTICGTILDTPVEQSEQPVVLETPTKTMAEAQEIQQPTAEVQSTAEVQPVMEAQQTMEAQPVPVAPFIQNKIRINEKDLVKITGNCWTNLFKTLNWVFFILEVVGAITLCVLHFMEYIDFVPGNNTILIIYTAGVVLAAFLLFGVNMLILSIASDITKTRKHLDNIEYILKTENQN